MAGTVAAGQQCPPRWVWAGRRSRVGARGGRLGGSQMSFFGRVLTAMVTPFDEAANVDYPQAAALATRLANSGSDGIVVAGTTGESPPLTDEEKNRLFGAVKEAVAGPAAGVARTRTNDTRASSPLTKDAGRAGADALLPVK